MTKGDLDPQKSMNNVEEFKGYANYLCENQGVLWRYLLVNFELSISINTLYSFCVNIRTQVKSGVQDSESTSTNWVFKAFHNLLEQIKFHFTGLINLPYNVITF